MLGLEITSPVNRVLELVFDFFQLLDRFGVGQVCKLRMDDPVKPLDQPLVIEIVEKRHLLRALLKYIGEYKFYHILCKVHVILKICKRNLRLDHPEFRCMAGRIGVFCAEGRPERVNIRECQRHTFPLQLPGDGEIGRLAEKVLRVIYLSVLGKRRVQWIKGGDPEHLPCPLRVTAGNQRGMHINETAFVEKLMDCVSRDRPHPEHCCKGIGARTQMRDRTQEFKRMALLLERIVRSGSPFRCV